MATADKETSKYRVVGHREVFGHPTGSVFEADLSEEQERALIDGGHLEKARADAKVQDAAQPRTEG